MSLAKYGKLTVFGNLLRAPFILFPFSYLKNMHFHGVNSESKNIVVELPRFGVCECRRVPNQLQGEPLHFVLLGR